MKKHYYFTLLFILTSFGISFAQSNLYLHFDGVDDHVRLDNASALLNGSNTISMTGWFYPDNLNYGGGLMGLRGEGTGTGGMYVLMLGNGKLECRVLTGTGTHQIQTAQNAITPNQWNHIAWVWNQTTLTLYINGTQIGTSTASGTFQATNRPFGIGKSLIPGYNFIYTGRADEVTLWNKALSAAEVSAMITNELTGNESNLLLYYKFDQGIPNADNSSITQLHSETGTSYDGDLMNFSLNGNTSNFGGTLEADFQSISFPSIATKITSDAPFALNAVSSSGLPITYTVMSGPATVNGNIVTLNGTEGEVIIKASQAGNTQYNAASNVFNSFNVVDPMTNLPQIELTNPTPGSLKMPTLSATQLAAVSSIPYDDTFSVQSLAFQVDGQTIPAVHHGNGFYTAWWTPSSFGSHTIDVISTNNFNYSSTVSNTVNVSNFALTQNVTAASQVWVYSQVYSQEVEVTLPSFVGAYSQINGTLNIDCPSGGCDPWDRVSHVEVQGHDGNWYEIIRYLTPYGVACSHNINLTDFMSLLQGKVKFRFTLGTSGNGFLYTLNLQYVMGAPTYKYSTVEPLWNNTYSFGNMANLQPCEILNVNFDSSVQAAKIKMVSTGHGWGDNNSGNAAEFHHDYHHIWVNGAQTFTQDNWNICNPNPDNCSPQNGTWYYNRAGWCPGSIAQFFDFNLTPFIGNNVELKYILDQNYVDYCHPSNPDCVSGVTCPNCNDGFNPHLIVDSYLIKYSNSTNFLSSETFETTPKNFVAYPNPSTGKFTIENYTEGTNNEIAIYNTNGALIYEKNDKNLDDKFEVDLSDKAKGVYIIKFKNNESEGVQKIIIE
ncbi:LamG-like jellyroll fold domain-containing protein [Flavobacterium chuncheonense]|uniref:LamG-like jellyroll fold domain-containing protein n=1 Tax=Flavobacterium chuncheonense TaxID=2026653 RepID=A0ABW5YHB7_9FLAO